jgi:pimeloyl-ACP methyl ester carboxylesterase
MRNREVQSDNEQEASRSEEQQVMECVNTKAPKASLPVYRKEQSGVVTDVRGICRLTTDAVTLTTQLVEAAHSRYDPFSNWLYPSNRGTDRAGGIAGYVYWSITAVTGAVGSTIDLILSTAETMLRSDAVPNPSPKRDQIVAVLNGVVGDYLQKRGNPLEIHMEWRIEGITQSDDMLRTLIRNFNQHLLILVHGSCSTDLLWKSKDGHCHGEVISSELGSTPIYLYYNTGLHISDNGKLLALQLNRIASIAASEEVPLKVDILAHSMGGLVVRSACHYATVLPEEFDTAKWLPTVRKLVFLGTPHHGALLERFGKWIDRVLSMHRYIEPFSWIGKIRSNGVNDLGYGNVRDEDWMHDHPSKTDDHRLPTPLSTSMECYAIAAILISDTTSNHFYKNVVGDGLVTESSALGRHENTFLTLKIPLSHQKTIHSVSHLGLLSSIPVCQMISSFLADAIIQ